MKCLHCEKIFKNSGGLGKHEKACPSNPNRVKFDRSKLAGQKKGSTPWNKGLSSTTNHFEDKFPLEMVMVENSTYPRHSLKRRILKNDLIKYECQICHIGPVWQDQPMPLILDHINGINNDNRLSNLRFVCSNCDSQLLTYKSRNRRRVGGAV